ncbi:MAG TPA: alkaline phosphatase family protein [Candidatus Nitrosotalea sp.]|nr:alkaline phosphatase family protein [Candidatus Nitrosotalea sp.]
MPRVPALIALAALLAGCSGGGPSGAGLPFTGLPGPRFPVQPSVPSGKIKHVVIVVQENRSFNDLFYGYPKAKTAKYGYDTYGNKIALQPVGLETTWDISHSSYDFIAACNGTGKIPGTHCRNNGFDNEYWGCSKSGYPTCPNQNPPYSYVPHAETKPYFDIAHQYVLADQMYASNFDASSFVSHQYIISGQAESAVNYPFGAWGCPGGSGDQIATVGPKRQVPESYEQVCWDPTTLGDELDKANVSWAYYAVSYSGYPGLWSAYQAINHIYNGPDWQKDVISQPNQFLNDVSNGNLRAVSWVTPTWGDSDHAGSGSKMGPSWVASIVNAVGESKYWNSTAIFIFWDDYGGWFDPEPPAYADYDGLGMRIPMLVVSPYAKQDHVSHVRYEHGSILKFVENQFGLGRLAAADRRANSPAKDCFDFNQTPRKFVPIKSSFDINFFLRQPPDHHEPDTQ